MPSSPSNPDDPGAPDDTLLSANTTTGDPLIGKVVLGRYQILERIGAGGMGSVYVGTQRGIERKVALKVLRSELVGSESLRERFRREAEIIATLRHPNTVQLIDYGETPDGLSVMVMELLVGEPLNKRLERVGPLPLADTLALGEEIASALSEAHMHGLVHRDLKPANIFLVDVANQTHAKVLDFGIARILDEAATRLTSTGQVFGTPRYMAPEQAMATGEVDARADIYSLGLILYECVVGQPPFVAQTSLQYLSAHSTMTPPKLRERAPGAPSELERLISLCLEKEPEDRPRSTADVAKTLASIRLRLEVGLSDGIAIPRANSKAEPVAFGAATLANAVPPDATRAKELSAPRPMGAAVVVLGMSALAIGAVLAYFHLASTREPVAVGIGSDAPATRVAIDAGVLAEVSRDTARERDTSSSTIAQTRPASLPVERDRVVAEAPLPDAGIDDPAEDAGVAPRPRPKISLDTRSLKPSLVPQNLRKHDAPPARDRAVENFGGGAIEGPRVMTIEGADDDGDDVVAMAKTCKTSMLKGVSKLSTRDCAPGCAIVVDSVCGGLTPASDREIAPGAKDVAVVCEGKVAQRKRIAFEAEKTTTFGCR